MSAGKQRGYAVSAVIVEDRMDDLAGSGGTREGQVLSRNSPSTPPAMNRSCQRHTQGLLLPVRGMISTVPRPYGSEG